MIIIHPQSSSPGGTASFYDQDSVNREKQCTNVEIYIRRDTKTNFNNDYMDEYAIYLSLIYRQISIAYI